MGQRMKNLNRAVFAMLLFLSIVSPSIWAQEGSGPQLSLFWDIASGKSADDVKYAEIISRTAVNYLSQAKWNPIPTGELKNVVKGFDRLQLETEVLSQLIELAKEQGSNFLMLISLIKEDVLILKLQIWDIEKKSLFEFKEIVQGGLEIYNRLNEAIVSLDTKLAKLKGQEHASVIPPTQTRKGYVQTVVLLSGDEGTEIYLNRIMRLGVITEGRLTLPYLPLTLGSKIVIEKRKEGYFNDVEEFVLEDEWQELPLRPLEKIIYHEGLFIYSIGQLAGFGLGYRYHFIPGKLFVGGENYLFLQIPASPEGRIVWHDDLRALVGFYLLNIPGFPYKIELSTGIGAVFTLLTIPNAPLFTDFYFNLVNITIGFRLWDFEFYVREELKLALGLGPNLLGFNFILINGQFPIFTMGVKLPL